ncbi:MAG TPA: MJ1477/TM1410 family putative glycoside hydrolase [Candidatus Nitrosotenuis sp.]|jgi:cysteinyl-tRNA synthetase|nr:MJ1477/TM1410 family putative glycoside hydrolase [Candidatus Nitrosotenuis sp.]
MRLLALLALLSWPLVSLAGGARRPWAQAQSWAVQLQSVDLEALAQSPFDLVVIDYSSDGSAAGRYTRADIEAVQRHPAGGRRLVLAYLSVGEAESYRFYWQPGFRPGSPAWLGRENPEWPGNYLVNYWEPEWRSLLEKYLDQIVEAGFDGVYLDRVDAYQSFEVLRPTARDDMVELVRHLAARARQGAGGADFGIFPQNGAELLGNPWYLKTITGCGHEETYFGYGGDDRPSPADWTAQVEACMDLVKASGGRVLSLDYTNEPEQMRQAHLRAAQKGYLEYCAPRDLDTLVVLPGIQPYTPSDASARHRPGASGHPTPAGSLRQVSWRRGARRPPGVGLMRNRSGGFNPLHGPARHRPGEAGHPAGSLRQVSWGWSPGCLPRAWSMRKASDGFEGRAQNGVVES